MILVFASGVLLLTAAFLFVVRLLFATRGATAVAIASLTTVRHKKNVPVYGSNYGRHIRTVRVMKKLSKGIYYYTVDTKCYRIRYAKEATARQMPAKVSVVYLKRCPGIAYVKSDTCTFLIILPIMSLVLSALGVILLISAFTL